MTSSSATIYQAQACGKVADLYFKFYDAFGDLKYSIPWRPTSPSRYIPIAPERITNAALEKTYPPPTQQDKMTRGYMEKSIDKSLLEFDELATKAKETGFVSRNGTFPDKNFTYSSWELVRNTDGFCFAKGKPGTSPYDWHIGEGGGVVTTDASAALNERRKANDAGDTLARAKYELHCYDDNGDEAYVLDFQPIGGYSFGSAPSKWDLIDTTTRKEFKTKPNNKSYISAIIKWFNEAVQTTLDDLIEKSNDAPEASGEKPARSLDADFTVSKYKIFRNGEYLCWGDYSDFNQKYVKFSNTEW